MMSALPQIEQSQMTEEEYLAFERTSKIKHEYMDGVVYAMSGASRAHNLIVLNIGGELRTRLRKRPCEIYPSDMRVKLPTEATFAYPDVTITCGEPQFTDDEADNLLNPTVIFEVLSQSTEGYDRGKKFQHYRAIESLQSYVLVSQHTPRIEHFTRVDDDTWLLTDVVGLEAILKLPTIACELPLAEIYEKVTFENPSHSPIENPDHE